MQDLDMQPFVEGYLRAARFNLLDTREGFVVGDRPEVGGHRDTRLVWIAPPLTRVDERDRPQLRHRLLREMRALVPQYPNATDYTLLAHDRGGFANRDFLTDIGQLGVKLRVPIQYFDTPYVDEEAPRAASTVRTLRDTSLAQRRVPQPFEVFTDGELGTVAGDDLAQELFRDITSTEGAALRIVVGPAGAGKSVLFQALFSRLYEYFQAEKRALRVFPRPMPMIPEYLRSRGPMRIHRIIDSFMRSEVASPVSRDTFDWMLANGFSTLLCDGLDEVYAGDPEFFDFLLEALTTPSSKAQILVCAREALLTSSEALTDFLEEYGSEETVSIYRLSDWNRDSKRVFAWIQVEGRRPRNDERDPSAVSGFLDTVNSNASLEKLSGLPDYCSVMIERFLEEGDLRTDQDEGDLLSSTVREMIQREEGKGLLHPERLVLGGLQEWLETTAVEFYLSDFKGMSAEEIKEYALLVLRDDLSENEQEETATSLLQFPLFSMGMRPGVITFTHELLAEFLAAERIAQQLSSSQAAAAQALSWRRGVYDTLFARCLASRVGGDPALFEGVVRLLREGGLQERAFGNWVQISALGFS